MAARAGALRWSLAALALLSTPAPGEGTGRAAPPSPEADARCGAGTAMRLVPGGPFLAGSDRAERVFGYDLSPPAVREAGWYDRWEQPRRTIRAGPVCLDVTPVTRKDYLVFVEATGHRVPDIGRAEYERQGFLVHGYEEVERFRWRGGRPPPSTATHPVVLVSGADAAAYCAWRGEHEGRRLRLPAEDEWEKGARGTDGRWFPWGNAFDAAGARTAAEGQPDTAPVDAHPAGRSPYGLLDMAGNVFQWTSSAFDATRAVLKGCSWDDAPGTCRAAFRHGRPRESRHILIGFRCAGMPAAARP